MSLVRWWSLVTWTLKLKVELAVEVEVRDVLDGSEVLRWGLQLDGRGASSASLAWTVFQPNGGLLATIWNQLWKTEGLSIIEPWR